MPTPDCVLEVFHFYYPTVDRTVPKIKGQPAHFWPVLLRTSSDLLKAGPGPLHCFFNSPIHSKSTPPDTRYPRLHNGRRIHQFRDSSTSCGVNKPPLLASPDSQLLQLHLPKVLTKCNCSQEPDPTTNGQSFLWLGLSEDASEYKVPSTELQR